MVVIGKVLILFLIWEVFASSTTSTKKSQALSTPKPSTITKKQTQSSSQYNLTTKNSSIRATTTKRLPTVPGITTKKSLLISTSTISKASGTTKKALQVSTKKSSKASKTTKNNQGTTNNTNINIKNANEAINQIYANLNVKESRIARAMQREIIRLKTSQRSVSSNLKFSSVINDTIKLYVNTMTNANFPVFQIQSSQSSPACSSVVIKAYTIQRDIKRFMSVQSCASINSTYLSEQVNLMKDSSVKYKKLINSSVDFKSHVESGIDIVREMQNYTSMIEDAVKIQAKIVDELNAYKNRYCMFQLASSDPDIAIISSSKDNSKCCASGGTGKWCCLNSADNSDCKIPAPCGSLLDLEINDPFDSRTRGLQSGKFIDGSTVFPGTGIFSICNGATAARITTSKADKGMGAYTVCFGDENKTLLYDDFTAKYFYAHHDLRWTKTTPVNLSSVPRAIKVINSKQEIRFVARFNLSFNDQVYSQIGYYISERGISIYWNGNTSIETKDDFEVLTCDECTNGGSGLYCCMNGAENPSCCLNGGAGQFCCKNGADNPECSLPLRCGSLLDLKSNNPLNISTLGLNLGATDDGSIFFPGTGYNYDCAGENPATIALFPNNSGSGAYMQCNDADFITFDNSSAKYFYAHPQLKWVTTTKSIISKIPRSVKVMDKDGDERFLIRKAPTVEDEKFLQVKYFTEDDENYSSNETIYIDILACGECTNGGKGTFCCPNGEENFDCCPDGGSGQWCCKNGQDNPTCALPLPCGSLLSLSSNDPLNPLTPGFKAGTYIDGSDVYLGEANFSKCDGQLPSRISISNNYSGPGAYSTCYSWDDVYESFGRYFYAHSQLKWVLTSTKDVNDIPRKINLPSDKYEYPEFNIGRINLTYNGQNFSQIGYYSRWKGFFYYFNGEKSIKSKGNFEVLTCEECTNGGSGPWCCKNGAINNYCCSNGYGQYCCENDEENPECKSPFKCGSTLDLKSNNPYDSLTPGLKSGTYIDGSTVFPGIGYFGQCNGKFGNVARISTSNFDYGPGAYILCLYDMKNQIHLYDGFRGEYFYAHPRLKWVKTSMKSVYELSGKVEVFDSYKANHLVARFNFTIGNKTFSQITYFYEGDNILTYWNGAKNASTLKDFDVLTCEKEN